MSKLQHLAAYKVIIAELIQCMKDMLNSSDPAELLLKGQSRIGVLNERASFHLNAAQ